MYMNGMRDMEDHEIPGVQPMVPEKRMPSDSAGEYEIRRGIIDGMNSENDEEKIRLERIEEIIRRRDHAGQSDDTDHAGYRLEAENEVAEAKRGIDRAAELIGAFGERSFLDRILHYPEYQRLQEAYDAAIRKEHGAEERLRISRIAGEASGD